MNQPETRRKKLSAPTEKEAVTDRSKILREHFRPNSENVSRDKIGKRFLIKRQAKVGT
ncbi:MAG: hypothetical protein NPIRA06_33360 [Nitrospirales bacterium]|nr:MAG: hypothetical protein NPIRA06_33360 [Nitrospirales bacterium]